MLSAYEMTRNETFVHGKACRIALFVRIVFEK